MVRYCVAFGCSEKYRKGSGVQFHKFPRSCPKLLKSWENAVRRKNWRATVHSTLCSKHFTEESYQVRPGALIKRLRDDAVPSLFSFSKPKENFRRQLSFKTSEVLETSNGPMEASEPPSKTEVMETEQPSHSVMCQQTQTDGSLNSPTKTVLRKKVKRLQSKLRRRDRKINNFSELLSELKAKVKISSDLEQVLLNNFSGFPLEFVMNLKNNDGAKTASRYSDTMKQFSLTLHFYSPKAYKFLRKHFPLPHPNRLKSWISSVNCQPGYLDEVFRYLEENKNNPSFADLNECSLVFDSMSIRKQLIWDECKKKFVGNVDFGGVATPDNDELAKEALVIQIVSYTKKFRCPVAYFLVNGISSCLLAEVIRNCLVRLQDVGVTVRSVTCDSTAANLQALNNLGCNISPVNLKSFFKHPSLDINVYAILDPSHMLRLARNALAEKQLFAGPDGDIKWSFIVKLQQLQHEEQLNFANSLGKGHVNFQNKKMKVSLAVQTLSSSVANAIEFLDSADHPEFKGSKATVLFLRKFDKLFDVLNSRSVFGKGFKQPLNIDNINQCQTFFKEMEIYMLDLKFDGIPAVYHGRKTFVLGLITSMKSVELLATELLFREESPLKYFLTYKLSQDHLELFFGCVRARGGWNNNPNCQQFQAAMKALLLKNSVTPGSNSNVIESNYSPYLSVCNFRSKKQATPTNIEPFNNESNQYFEALDSESLSDYQNNILYYIAGFISRKLRNSLDCIECVNLLLVNKSLLKNEDHNYAKLPTTDYSGFTKKIDNGGLILASESVYKVVKFCETSFRRAVKVCYLSMNQHLINGIVKHCIRQPGLFSDHSVASAIDVEDLHTTKLIKKIVVAYVTLRGKAHGKRITMQEQKSYGVRQKLTKVITFSNV